MPVDVRDPETGVIYRVHSTNDPEEARQRVRAQLERGRSRSAPQSDLSGDVASRAAQRQIARAASPLGIGHIAQPLANAVMDPTRRAELGRSAQNFARDVRNIPNLDGRRVVSDLAQQANAGVQNFPQIAGQIAQNIPQILAEATFAPFAREEQAQRQIDMQRALGEDPTQAARQANAETGQIGINVAAPLLMGGSTSALRAAAVGAGATAPMAFAGEEPLQERVPRGILGTLGGAALGAGVQATANALPGILNAPTRAQRTVQAFDRIGVNPSYAAANAGSFGGTMTGALTNTIADNPVAGVAVRPRIGRQMEQAASASRRIQGGYGSTQTPEGAGAVVQRGLRRYATDSNAPNPRPHADPRTIDTSEWSVPAQADALYDHALRPVESNPTTLSRTVRAIQEVEALADNDPVVRSIWADPSLRDVSNAAHELYTRPGQPLTLRAARELRRRMRIRMEGAAREGGQDAASLRRVYSALTEDIYDAAGPAAANLRKADQFYQRSMNRVNETLSGLVNVNDPAAVAPSQAFHTILRAADARRGNLRLLAGLKNALRPAEMRTLAASLLDYMGQPTPGAGGTQAAELGFSANAFSTQWRAMSPVARRMIFGSRNNALVRELDDLATVVDALKGVERTANNSGSGRYANIGLTAFSALKSWELTAATLLGGVAVGELLTRPMFVRWLTSAAKASQRPGGMRATMRDLSRLAASDPAIAAYAADLSQRAPALAGDPANTPQPRAPALQ